VGGALLVEGELVGDEWLDAPFALTGEVAGELLRDFEGEEAGDEGKRAGPRVLLFALPAEGEDGDPVCWRPVPDESALRLPEAPSSRSMWLLPRKLRIGEAGEHPLVRSIDCGCGEAEAVEDDGDGAGEEALL
jgi:hypothetical protein